MADDYGAFGTFRYGEWEEPEGWVDGAPTSAKDQYCAFCAAEDVTWVHPLDSAKVAYRAWGNGYTLPSFWALCERCEQLYQDGDDEGIVAVQVAADATRGEDIGEDIRKPLAVFRRADLGGRRFTT